MCGRTACILNRDTLRRACDYKNASGTRVQPGWAKTELEYKPSSNIGPRDVLPCLVDGSRLEECQDERVLCAMMWGMIPPWHEGDYRKHTMSTHNARLENVQSSKLYGPTLRRGQRCVVVCDGYYEWKAGKTKKDSKQPYYIYAAQEKGVRADDPGTWTDEWSPETGWKGFKVLKMAGLFNTFKTAEGKIVHSCSVLTRDANHVISWLHTRAPAFLLDEDMADAWLSKDVSMNEALDMLNKSEASSGALAWHPVSTMVNNVRYKNDDCRKEIQIKEEKKNSPTSFMASWLKKGSTNAAKRKGDAEETEKTSREGERPAKISRTD